MAGPNDITSNVTDSTRDPEVAAAVELLRDAAWRILAAADTLDSAARRSTTGSEPQARATEALAEEVGR